MTRDSPQSIQFLHEVALLVVVRRVITRLVDTIDGRCRAAGVALSLRLVVQATVQLNAFFIKKLGQTCFRALKPTRAHMASTHLWLWYDQIAPKQMSVVQQGGASWQHQWRQ